MTATGRLDSDERKAGTNGDVDPSLALEKDAVGSGSVDLPEAGEVLSLEGEVAVVRDAQRHRHVRGLVALEPVRRLQDVERDGGGGQENEEGQDDQEARFEPSGPVWFATVVTSGR